MPINVDACSNSSKFSFPPVILHFCCSVIDWNIICLFGVWCSLLNQELPVSSFSKVDISVHSVVDPDILLFIFCFFHCRSSHLPDAETDTNPVDRTVAHLLFYRPTEPYGRLSKDGFAEFPISGNPEKLPVQQKVEDCLSPPTKCLSASLTNQSNDSYQEAQLPSIAVDPQQENQF